MLMRAREIVMTSSSASIFLGLLWLFVVICGIDATCRRSAHRNVKINAAWFRPTERGSFAASLFMINLGRFGITVSAAVLGGSRFWE